jgi:hypothetical protein
VRGPILAELRLMLSSDLPYVGGPPQGDDYLLDPVDVLAAGKGSEGQILRGHRGRPKDRPSPSRSTAGGTATPKTRGSSGPASRPA